MIPLPVGMAPGTRVGFPIVTTPDTVSPGIAVSTTVVVGAPPGEIVFAAPLEGILGCEVFGGEEVPGCDEDAGVWVLVGLETPLDPITLAVGLVSQSPLDVLSLPAGARSLQSDSHTCNAPLLGSTATYYRRSQGQYYSYLY